MTDKQHKEGDIVEPSLDILRSEDLVFPCGPLPDGSFVVVSPVAFPAKVCARLVCHNPVAVAVEFYNPDNGEMGGMRFCQEDRPRWRADAPQGEEG